MHSQVLYWTGPYGQMWYQIGSNEYQYQENAVTFVMKIIVYFYSMVKCGTNYVPVTIIINVSKHFYSMVNSSTKLIPVTGVLKYRNNSIKYGQVWYQISPTDHINQSKLVFLFQGHLWHQSGPGDHKMLSKYLRCCIALPSVVWYQIGPSEPQNVIKIPQMRYSIIKCGMVPNCPTIHYYQIKWAILSNGPLWYQYVSVTINHY